MEELFNAIRASYNSLWHVKVLGESLEIVTPMVTTNDLFVSVFVTKRGDDYIVTDGGWISAGYYDFDVDNLSPAYNKLFQYYFENYKILQTIGYGRTMYYKRVRDQFLVVNAVFELSNFISAVVSGSNIQFLAEKKELRFSRTVRDYLTNGFEEGSFQFNRGLTPDSSIRYGAISNFSGHLQLLNIVTGSNAGYYRDSLCRSNFYFEAARAYRDRFRINRTVALLDDSTPSVYGSPQVGELVSILRSKEDSILLPWSEKDQLPDILAA